MIESWDSVSDWVMAVYSMRCKEKSRVVKDHTLSNLTNTYPSSTIRRERQGTT